MCLERQMGEPNDLCDHPPALPPPCQRPWEGLDLLTSYGNATHQFDQSLLHERLLLSPLYRVARSWVGWWAWEQQPDLWTKQGRPGFVLTKMGWWACGLGHLPPSSKPKVLCAHTQQPPPSPTWPRNPIWPSLLTQCLAAEFAYTTSKQSAAQLAVSGKNLITNFF